MKIWGGHDSSNHPEPYKHPCLIWCSTPTKDFRGSHHFLLNLIELHSEMRQDIADGDLFLIVGHDTNLMNFLPSSVIVVVSGERKPFYGIKLFGFAIRNS